LLGKGLQEFFTEIVDNFAFIVSAQALRPLEKAAFG